MSIARLFLLFFCSSPILSFTYGLSFPENTAVVTSYAVISCMVCAKAAIWD